MALSKKKKLMRMKQLTMEVKTLRQARNALMSSGVYSTRNWLDQKRRIHAGKPTIKDEEELVDATWAMQHQRAEELAIEIRTMMNEEVMAKLRHDRREMMRCPVCGLFRGTAKHGHEVGAHTEQPLTEREMEAVDNDESFAQEWKKEHRDMMDGEGG